MSLSEIAFELISGNYYWGRYGEFKVIVDISTGYINATHLCRLAELDHGKSRKFNDWSRAELARNLISEVSSSTGYPVNDLIMVLKGLPNELRGTYAHPDLIPHIASWASPKFAVRVSRIVNEYIIREYKDSIRAKDQKIDRLMAEVKTQTAKIDEQSAKIDQVLASNQEMFSLLNTALEEFIDSRLETEVTNSLLQETTASQASTEVKVDIIAEKLGVAVERRVPLDPVRNRNEVFCVMRRPNTREYRVYRCQHRASMAAFDKLYYMGYKKVVYYKEDPNAVNIWNRVKSGMPPEVGIITRAVCISAPSQRQLIGFIKSVEAEKANV